MQCGNIWWGVKAEMRNRSLSVCILSCCSSSATSHKESFGDSITISAGPSAVPDLHQELQVFFPHSICRNMKSMPMTRPPYFSYTWEALLSSKVEVASCKMKTMTIHPSSNLPALPASYQVMLLTSSHGVKAENILWRVPWQETHMTHSIVQTWGNLEPPINRNMDVFGMRHHREPHSNHGPSCYSSWHRFNLDHQLFK